MAKENKKIAGYRCKTCKYGINPEKKSQHKKETGHKIFEPIFLMS